jgi:hypothetical protein
VHHGVVGDLELNAEPLTLPGYTGLTIVTYTVEPAGPSEQALGFPASWSRTSAPVETSPAELEARPRER